MRDQPLLDDASVHPNKKPKQQQTLSAASEARPDKGINESQVRLDSD